VCPPPSEVTSIRNWWTRRFLIRVAGAAPSTMSFRGEQCTSVTRPDVPDTSVRTPSGREAPPGARRSQSRGSRFVC
jgi:hypothetical protein